MLAGVIDPELHVSIVELGMVDDIRVDPDGHVTVKVALTTAGCPLRHQIKTEVQSKVLGLPGVTDVTVDYGEMTAEQKAAAMDRARWNARERAEPTEIDATTRVLAVASGKGGVGKSSVTVNLAAATSGASRCLACSASRAGSAGPRARSTPTRCRCRTPSTPTARPAR
jgi:ATP-binding protein involved in chromosome partitioning